MVETITIRPEPLIPAGGARRNATALARGAGIDTDGRAIAKDGFIAHLKNGYMVKKGGSAADLRLFSGAEYARTNLAANGNGAQTQISTPAESDFGLYDLLDIINPLQHIPGISTLYREITGDSIKPAMKLAGGGLFGGVLGLASSALDTIIQEETGQDIGQNLLALFNHETAPATKTSLAANKVSKNPETASLTPVNTASIQASLAPITPPLPTAPISENRQFTAQNAQNDDHHNDDVLALFGASAASAHQSYQKADLLGYLHDVSISQTL
jgi:hypothetical protein